jgi:hypothetical protein
MKFRTQICFVLLVFASPAPTVLAQTATEKDPRTSEEANLLAPKTDSTNVGPINPTAGVNLSASDERKRAAVASAQNSLRAGAASLDAGHYKDAIALIRPGGGTGYLIRRHRNQRRDRRRYSRY